MSQIHDCHDVTNFLQSSLIMKKVEVDLTALLEPNLYYRMMIEGVKIFYPYFNRFATPAFGYVFGNRLVKLGGA